MQAENTHSRQKRQRLWYQRDGFLWGLVVALIAAAWGILPPAGTSLGIGGWLGMGLYMLLAAVPASCGRLLSIEIGRASCRERVFITV